MEVAFNFLLLSFYADVSLILSVKLLLFYYKQICIVYDIYNKNFGVWKLVKIFILVNMKVKSKSNCLYYYKNKVCIYDYDRKFWFFIIIIIFKKNIYVIVVIWNHNFWIIKIISKIILF